MRMLGWNCQGTGKGLGNPKMCHLARMIVATRAQVIFISEVKNSKCSPDNLVTRFNMADSIVVPSRKRSGGLWLMWTDDVSLTVHFTSFHVILAIVYDKAANLEFGLVRIYGDPYHRQTEAIWAQVANFVYDNSSLPMLCIGDMNDLLYNSDKSTPNVNTRRMSAFRSLVKSCGLFDLGFSGPAYTWTNRRFSSKPLYQRLDRCLVNSDWCVNYPVSNVYNMPLLHCFSDHAPILCSTDGNSRKTKNNFKFENWWLKEQDFQNHAKACWQQSRSKQFEQRTRHLASCLKVWCRKKKPLQEELQELD